MVVLGTGGAREGLVGKGGARPGEAMAATAVAGNDRGLDCKSGDGSGGAWRWRRRCAVDTSRGALAATAKGKWGRCRGR